MEDSSYLWWETIPSNKNYVELIVNSLFQSKIVIINNAEKIPFAHHLKKTVSSRLHGKGKSFRYLVIEDIPNPGKTLFDKYESDSRKPLFRAENEYGSFLGDSPHAPFHEHLIWVRCIKDPSRLKEWTHFIYNYLKHRESAIQKMEKAFGRLCLY